MRFTMRDIVWMMLLVAVVTSWQVQLKAVHEKLAVAEESHESWQWKAQCLRGWIEEPGKPKVEWSEGTLDISYGSKTISFIRQP